VNSNTLKRGGKEDTEDFYPLTGLISFKLRGKNEEALSGKNSLPSSSLLTSFLRVSKVLMLGLA
jgi:hypothetical protein